MVQSTVFSTSDYEALTSDETYLQLLRQIFTDTNVVFLGYSVRDEYVINTLIRAIGERQLFGAGEHFVVTASSTPLPSERLRRIRYQEGLNRDHRSCLQVLDLIQEASNRALQNSPTCDQSSSESSITTTKKETIYYIADLLPPGTWQTSQTAQIEGPDGVSHEMVIGSGYVDGEIQVGSYSAMHDIVVGLLCFDKIYFSLSAVGKVHTLLGSENFWRLVGSDALGMVLSREGLNKS